MIKLKNIIMENKTDYEVRRIALDMDGVLCDFDLQFKECLADDKLWNIILTNKKTISQNKLNQLGYNSGNDVMDKQKFIVDATELRNQILNTSHNDTFQLVKTQFKNKFGINPAWTIIGLVGEDFWSTMKPMTGADELVRYVKSTNIPTVILTAGKGSNAKTGKQKWLSNYGLGHLPFTIVDAGILKGEHAQVGDLLIDDKEENIDVFKQNGGDGIVHINTPKTIVQLKEKLNIHD